MTTYFYNDNEYETEDEVWEVIMKDHPELLDDDLPDFFNENVEEWN